jgi:hypothetical protein
MGNTTMKEEGTTTALDKNGRKSQIFGSTSATVSCWKLKETITSILKNNLLEKDGNVIGFLVMPT